MTFNIARKNLYLNSFKTEQRVHLTAINCRWNNLENVDYVGGLQNTELVRSALKLIPFCQSLFSVECLFWHKGLESLTIDQGQGKSWVLWSRVDLTWAVAAWSLVRSQGELLPWAIKYQSAAQSCNGSQSANMWDVKMANSPIKSLLLAILVSSCTLRVSLLKWEILGIINRKEALYMIAPATDSKQ